MVEVPVYVLVEVGDVSPVLMNKFGHLSNEARLVGAMNK
jgi:hypothetical protein